MDQKDYHKTTMCGLCGKVMRDNNLKRHVKIKHSLENSSSCHNTPSTVSVKSEQSHQLDTSSTVVNGHVSNEENVDAVLEFKLVRNNDAYKQNVDIGRQINTVINNGEIFEQSLAKEDKFCLDLFRAQYTMIDVKNATLKLWQMQLFDIIDSEQLNDRQIIWVKGAEGNEGKSWFQSYLQSYYGTHRVARFDISNKTSDLLHIISRCALATTDIFLFNHQRSLSSEDCCYSLLEMIKDGYASAPKFHGALLRIKTPNLVIVFSNRNPRIRSLSKDRWKIVFITRDGLTNDHEDWMWKKQTDDYDSQTAKSKKL